MSKSVEIQFGPYSRVLEFGKPTDRIDVITDVCKDNYFSSGRVKHDKNGKPFLSPVGFGTGGPEIFAEVVGQMPPNEVIEAIERGWIEFGLSENKTYKEQIYKELDRIKNGKRTLKLE